MTTVALRKKLTDYLQIADSKKIKAIYAILEDEIETSAEGWDDDFMKELNRRSKELKNGTVKTYTIAEAKEEAIRRVKSKRR